MGTAWRLTTRSPLPHEGAQPFLIDWGESVHPAEAALPTLELLDFRVETPEPEAARQVLEAFGDKVFDTVINRTVRFPETTVAGEPITSWAPKSAGAEAYRQLAREVIAR